MKGLPSTCHFKDVAIRAQAIEPVSMGQSLALTAPQFGDVYEAWFDHVVRWIRATGAPEPEWEDLAQEVFCVVERKLPTFRGGSLPAWLYRIMQRTVKDHRRLSWFRHIYSRPREIVLEEIRSASPSPEDLTAAREEERILFSLISKMSTKRRTAFVLFEIDGYRCEEIAELEGIPIATVWTRLHHARKDYFALVDALKRKEGLR